MKIIDSFDRIKERLNNVTNDIDYLLIDFINKKYKDYSKPQQDYFIIKLVDSDIDNEIMITNNDKIVNIIYKKQRYFNRKLTGNRKNLFKSAFQNNINIIDINGLIDYNKNVNDYVNLDETKYYNFLRTRRKNYNIDIPLGIICEYYNKLFDKYIDIYNDVKNTVDEYYYYSYFKRSKAFSKLEQSGLSIDKKRLKKILKKKDYFKKKNGMNIYNKLKKLDRFKSIIYPEWEIDKSYTGRSGTNYFNFNFMAMKKESVYRQLINSRFGNKGTIYSFDYDGFHPRIIDNMLERNEIPLDKNAHKFLTKKYFDNYDSEEDYNKVKQKIYKLLYGGDIKEKNNNYYKIIKDLTKTNKILKFKTNYNRKVTKKVERRKRLNYFIQMFEVDLMTEVIIELYRQLSNYKSTPFFYHYDSIYIDVLNKESNNVIDIVKNIMENIYTFKFKVDIQKGNNMRKIS